jgi:hypothetical protein
MNQLLILPISSVSLVFGLDWLPLISGRTERAAYRMARQHRATHLVLPGESAAAVGLVILRQDRRQRKRVLNSAAQNVAHIFSSGTIAQLLEVEPACYWLVAVHEGAVIARTDKLYRSYAQAQAALDDLKQAYPQLVVLGTADAPESLTLQAIVAASAVQTRLVAVARWRSALPWPMQGFVLVLVLMLLASRVRPVLFPASGALQPLAPVDAAAAWRTARAQAYRGLIVHGVHGTRLILNDLSQLPARLAGWLLIHASCTARQKTWQCEARYDRRDPQASNDSLLARAPESWTVQFVSMDQAKPVWTLDSAGLPLGRFSPKSMADDNRYLLSALQAIKPAFSQLQLGQPQPLPTAAPRDRQGREIPRPASLPRYMTRSVQISGPLRSASVLLPYTAAVGWKKILLSLNDLRQAGLSASRVNISFQGVLYETETDQGPDTKSDLHGRKPPVPPAMPGAAPPGARPAH